MALSLRPPPPPLLLLLLFLLPLSAAHLPRYANHTVGGPAGWLFDKRRNATAANYTAWASSQSFFLGDILTFNTDGKSTVIQTFNATTYALCNQRQDFGNLTSQFVPDDGESGAIAVELHVQGVNYFFSDAQVGLQCEHGMRFLIVVAHGRGLPEDAAPPPLPSPLPRLAPAQPEESGGRRRGLGLLDFACSGFLLSGILF